MNRNDAESVIKETIEYANNEIRKTKKKSRIIVIATIVSALFIIAFIGSCAVSYVTLDTTDPFSASSGLIRIGILGEEYVEVQESPKVILAKPNHNVLIKYMEALGYTEMRNEQMGSIMVFRNGDETRLVNYYQNRWCSKWVFIQPNEGNSND